MALVSYVLSQDFGANKAGDVISLDQEAAQELVDAGVLSEATADDVNGGGDSAEGGELPAPQLAALMDGFTKRLESSINKATEIAVSKATKPVQMPKVSAEPLDGKGGFA